MLRVSRTLTMPRFCTNAIAAHLQLHCCYFDRTVYPRFVDLGRYIPLLGPYVFTLLQDRKILSLRTKKSRFAESILNAVDGSTVKYAEVFCCDRGYCFFRVMACLMDHLHDRDMKKKCKSAILDLQYFVSRDFL